MLIRIVTAIVLALVRPGAAHAAGPYGELPRGFAAAPVTQLLRVNGKGIRSRTVSSDLAPIRACRLLERVWRSSGEGASVSSCRREGGWLLVSHRVGGQVQTAQLQETGAGSIGFLSEVDLFEPVTARPAPLLPLPAGARLVNVLQSVQQGDTVTAFTVESPLAPAAVLQQLQTGARRRGWMAVAMAAGNVVDLQRGPAAARAIAVPLPRGTTLVLVEHLAAGARP